MPKFYRCVFALATALALTAPLSGVSHAADRVVTLQPGHKLTGTVRLGRAVGGPTLKTVVPSDIAAIVFTGASDDEPVAGWFDRTFKASLKKNGMIAAKPEAAKYELNATVASMAITPLVTGSRHQSEVVYQLIDIATGAEVWRKTEHRDFYVTRGMRFGALGGAMGAALGGALAGQSPAVTAAMINPSQRGRRPFDVRIDIYEGIMRGFQQQAEGVVADLARSL
jgi:hypothetical protein